MNKHLTKLKYNGKTNLKSVIKFVAFAFLTKPGAQILKKAVRKLFWKNTEKNTELYDQMIKNKLDHDRLYKDYIAHKTGLKLQPLISIVMPVYNPPVHFLKQAVGSITGQLYDNWELCIADDNSTDPEVKKTLGEFETADSRIKVAYRAGNGHISVCTNTALQLVAGEYVLFMDHDDLITPNCLFEMVKWINQHPDHEIIYSDEDKVDDTNTFSNPHFKPDWAPDNLLSRNYIGHVVVMKKQLVDVLGGFRQGYEGSQDYDLLLRATELTDKIGHIPQVLYHWRIHEVSAAGNDEAKPYAYSAARKALDDALLRRKTPGTVETIKDVPGHYRIRYQVKNFEKVSIIIPTKDHAKLLQNAIDSIIKVTDYPDYEIIVLNNNSTDQAFFSLVDGYAQKHPTFFRCIEAAFPFNFSKLMNLGVAESKGAYMLLLNNDVEVAQSDWMTQMVSYAQRDKTGIVGVKLLYPDDKIQHAGVVLGMGGSAAHVFSNAYKKELGYFNYIQILNNYAALTAACMMCRKSIYEAVGGMDELLEVEYNDIDLCLKVLQKGYYNVYIPSVEVYHHESATRGHPYQSKESWKQHEKNFNYFRSKWQRMIDHDPFYNPNLSLETNDFRIKLKTDTI